MAKTVAKKQAAAEKTQAGKDAKLSPDKVAAKKEKERLAELENQAALRDVTRVAQKRDKEEKKAKAKEAKEAKDKEDEDGSPLMPRLDKAALRREAAKEKTARAEAAGQGRDAMSDDEAGAAKGKNKRKRNKKATVPSSDDEGGAAEAEIEGPLSQEEEEVQRNLTADELQARILNEQNPEAVVPTSRPVQWESTVVLMETCPEDDHRRLFRLPEAGVALTATHEMQMKVLMKMWSIMFHPEMHKHLQPEFRARGEAVVKKAQKGLR